MSDADDNPIRLTNSIRVASREAAIAALSDATPREEVARLRRALLLVIDAQTFGEAKAVAKMAVAGMTTAA